MGKKKKSVQILKSVNFWKNFGVKTNILKNYLGKYD